MESVKYIFDSLGPNKVTHPYETNIFEEGRQHDFSKSENLGKKEKPMSKPSPPSQPLSSHPQLPPKSLPNTSLSSTSPSSSSCPQTAKSLLHALMLLKHPYMSLLNASRINEEHYKFKNEVLNSVEHFDARLSKKLEIDKDHVKHCIEHENIDDQTIKYFAYFWNMVFATKDAIHGNITNNKCIVVNFDNFDLIDSDIEAHRKKVLEENSQKLNNVKDLKDTFTRLQIPTSRVCPETKKKKALLKSELQAVIANYISD